MSPEDFMSLSIIMAAKTRVAPGKEGEIPKVGAVIAIGDQLVAVSSRGKELHAEKIAIEEARAAGVDLTKATVYTTLEPCVANVRRRTLDSCADRLAHADVQKVVIGIHDPNKDVAGKGFLRLQEQGIATELFPEKLAHRIRDLNAEFIRGQRSPGVKIEYPQSGAELKTEPGKKVTLRGTWINRPEPIGSVRLIVAHGDRWWPQEEYLSAITTSDVEWMAPVGIGSLGPHRVIIGKINPLGRSLLQYYRRVIDENQRRFEAISQEHNLRS